MKYYLNNENTMDNTCKIFNCKKPSLYRWIQKYKTHKNLGRKSRKAVSYKINKDQVKTALKILDKNEQYTMSELSMLLKEKYNINKEMSLHH